VLDLVSSVICLERSNFLEFVLLLLLHENVILRCQLAMKSRHTHKLSGLS